MADMKFSCPQCGQHISYGETWAGHQIQCPACHSNISVPQVQMPSVAIPPSILPREVPKVAGPKLSAGATQAPRSTAPGPVSKRKFTSYPARRQSPLLKYAVLLAVVAALGGVGYFYGLPWLTNALQQEPNAKLPEAAKTSETGSARGGPLREVNGAMDVSEALDSGSSPKTRPAPATNNSAHPQPAVPRR